MNQDQVESQLSAMFDGELPAAECELLSRRIDRDENLRARWSRYALIGAAMRSEPVATARSGFSQRVSAALNAESRPRRARGTWWNSALAATLVAGVAGLSIAMLRDDASRSGTARLTASAGPATSAAVPAASAGALADGSATALIVPAGAAAREPWSYVTPTGNRTATLPLRTELADFIVAHSVYSTPLMERSLLSSLVGSGDGLDNAAGFAARGGATAAPPAVQVDAPAAVAAHGR